jgi:DNA-binding CsgD family transcriptional regulator
LLSQLAAPSAGGVTVLGGRPAGSPAALDGIAFVAQDTPLYKSLSAAARAALSNRESEVLALIAEGRSNRGIAEQVVLSGETVESHMRQIFAKPSLPDAGDQHRRVLAVLRFLRCRASNFRACPECVEGRPCFGAARSRVASVHRQTRPPSSGPAASSREAFE